MSDIDSDEWVLIDANNGRIQSLSLDLDESRSSDDNVELISPSISPQRHKRGNLVAGKKLPVLLIAIGIAFATVGLLGILGVSSESLEADFVAWKLGSNASFDLALGDCTGRQPLPLRACYVGSKHVMLLGNLRFALRDKSHSHQQQRARSGRMDLPRSSAPFVGRERSAATLTPHFYNDGRQQQQQQQLFEGVLDFHVTGSKEVICNSKRYTMAGQRLFVVDAEQCLPKGVRISTIKYCASQDEIHLSVATLGMSLSGRLSRASNC
jgi:hypothetical protein